jgi:hypothetical protein
MPCALHFKHLKERQRSPDKVHRMRDAFTDSQNKQGSSQGHWAELSEQTCCRPAGDGSSPVGK